MYFVNPSNLCPVLVRSDSLITSQGEKRRIYAFSAFAEKPKDKKERKKEKKERYASLEKKES